MAQGQGYTDKNSQSNERLETKMS
ncbi:hypothetical protein CCACVL1_15233 [Corchorus capsularis]|uniref:Uncharacterized protein n=1 Tax=Corchorus capsularis TaxID=210143 RepID=A0A1R3I358_COCAP|nr:hypothetical protein CCACVL1_30918 [Corchorus capsularis]OMO77010.1 hypothetical protein CCACVL1_15233 [Corchorus capsularis]